MNNLKLLYQKMVDNEVDSDTFSLNYNGRGLSCIFLIRDYGNTLYISTLGDNPQTIEAIISSTFKAPSFIEKTYYDILARYFGFTGASGNRFFPASFFEELDGHIKPILHRKATIAEIAGATIRSRRLPDGDKTFFCGWRKNPKGSHVTDENYLLTKAVVSEKAAKDLKRGNISSCWTSDWSKENLTALAKYIAEH